MRRSSKGLGAKARRQAYNHAAEGGGIIQATGPPGKLHETCSWYSGKHAHRRPDRRYPLAASPTSPTTLVRPLVGHSRKRKVDPALAGARTFWKPSSSSCLNIP
jgi:hypothetical protein